MGEWTLAKSRRFAGVDGPVVVCVMDGVGYGRKDESDAVWLARTPTLDWLAANTPTTALVAHGKAVGMPTEDDMGNSEVGHNALGAGRVFDQGAKLVSKAVKPPAASSRASSLAVADRAGDRARPGARFDPPLPWVSSPTATSTATSTTSSPCSAAATKKQIRNACGSTSCWTGGTSPRRAALDYVDALEELLETIFATSRTVATTAWPRERWRTHEGRPWIATKRRLGHGRARLEDPCPRRGARLQELSKEAIETLSSRRVFGRSSIRYLPAIRDRGRRGPTGRP